MWLDYFLAFEVGILCVAGRATRGLGSSELWRTLSSYAFQVLSASSFAAFFLIKGKRTIRGKFNLLHICYSICLVPIGAISAKPPFGWFENMLLLWDFCSTSALLLFRPGTALETTFGFNVTYPHNGFINIMGNVDTQLLTVHNYLSVALSTCHHFTALERLKQPLSRAPVEGQASHSCAICRLTFGVALSPLRTSQVTYSCYLILSRVVS